MIGFPKYQGTVLFGDDVVTPEAPRSICILWLFQVSSALGLAPLHVIWGSPALSQPLPMLESGRGAAGGLLDLPHRENPARLYEPPHLRHGLVLTEQTPLVPESQGGPNCPSLGRGCLWPWGDGLFRLPRAGCLAQVSELALCSWACRGTPGNAGGQPVPAFGEERDAGGRTGGTARG